MPAPLRQMQPQARRPGATGMFCFYDNLEKNPWGVRLAAERVLQRGSGRPLAHKSQSPLPEFLWWLCPRVPLPPTGPTT